MTDPSTRELATAIARLQASLDQADDRYVGNKEYQADQRTQAARDKSHNHRLNKLEDGHAWIMRGLAGLAFGLLIQVVILVVATTGWF